MNLRRHLHLVYIACGLPVLAVYLFLPNLPANVLYCLLGFGAFVASAQAGYRLSDWQRRFWWLLACGLACFVAADAVSAWYAVGSNDIPFPSFADAIYIVGYLFWVAGCLLLVVKRSRRDRLLDSGMLAVSVAFAGFVLLIEPNDAGFDLATVTAIAYPIMDVILFSLLAWLVLSNLGVTYRWLALSLAVLLSTDVIYAQLLLHSSYNGGAIDLGWMVSYLLWGAAAVHSSASWVPAERPARRLVELLAPVVAFFTLPLVLILQVAVLGRVDPWDTALGGLGLALLATLRLTRLISSEQRFRTRAEQSERHFRSLIENSTDIFTVLSADGRIAYESPSIEKTLGYEAHELVGESVLDYVHPDDAEFVAERIADLGNPSGEPSYVHLRFKHKDGHWVPLQSIGSNRLDDPAVRGLVICSRDVTDELAGRAAQERLQQDLHQAQKMDAIGRLAGGVAHDFNNLLMVISASTESALLELPDDEASMRKKLDQTAHAVRRAAALTQQLLTFSRRQQPVLEAVDVNAQIETTCGMLRRLIGENVHIALDLAGSLPPIAADPAQIDQVLLNLALNARDAMPAGGTIGFSTDADGDSVTLAVSDTGIGLDEETRARLFEPFFTTKQPGSGTGLGLATVYGIVTQSRGAIQVESEVGVGTTFTLSFPAAEGAPVEVADEPVGASAEGRETVLLVEDEEIVRSVVREGLEQHGYRVIDTGDPRTAVALALDYEVDVLITDVRMPHLDGFELYDRLREVMPSAKAVFISGYSGTAYAHRHHGRGTAFIAKPFAISDLTQALRGLLEQSATRTAA